MEKALTDGSPKQASIYVGGSVRGDVVGRDKFVMQGGSLSEAMSGIADVVGSSPAEKRSVAQETLASLREELSRGAEANDGKMARMIDGLVGLVPQAAGAVAAAFSRPLLQELTGPATQFILNKLHANG